MSDNDELLSETVAILDVAAFKKRPDLLVRVLPKYERADMRGYVFRLHKANRSTVDLRAIHHPNAPILRADPFSLVEADASEIAADTAKAEPALPPVNSGSVVFVDSPRFKEPAGSLWVVTAVKGTDVALSRLGGLSNGRQYPKIPRAMISVVPPEALSAAVAADPGLSEQE